MNFAPFISAQNPIYSLNLTTDRNPPLSLLSYFLKKKITIAFSVKDLPRNDDYVLLLFGHGNDKETKIYFSEQDQDHITRESIIEMIQKQSKGGVVILACICGGSAFSGSTTTENIEWNSNNFSETDDLKFLDWAVKFLSPQPIVPSDFLKNRKSNKNNNQNNNSNTNMSSFTNNTEIKSAAVYHFTNLKVKISGQSIEHVTLPYKSSENYYCIDCDGNLMRIPSGTEIKNPISGLVRFP